MGLDELVQELNGLALDEKNRSHPGRVQATTGAVQRFSQTFVAASEDQRRRSRAGFTDDARLLLLNFAWDSAEQAVQLRLAPLVAAGLLSIAIEGGELDSGLSAVRLAVLCRSAQRLGINAKTLFAQAADWATSSEIATVMRGFPASSEDESDLDMVFRIRETNSEDGFHYVQQALPDKHDSWSDKLRHFFAGSEAQHGGEQ
jgi:hypothetical protein